MNFNEVLQLIMDVCQLGNDFYFPTFSDYDSREADRENGGDFVLEWHNSEGDAVLVYGNKQSVSGIDKDSKSFQVNSQDLHKKLEELWGNYVD